MRKRTKPLPQTIEAARAELAHLERRMRADKERAEAVTNALGNMHPAAHRIPAVGSRWVRTTDMSRFGQSMRGRVLTTPYEFVAYAHPELGSPVFILLGDFGDSKQHSAVTMATFWREFDPAPAPAKRARKRRAAS